MSSGVLRMGALLLVAAAACKNGAPPPAPVAVAPAEPEPALPAIMQPASGARCRPPFARGYRFVGSAADTATLFRIIWRDGVSRGDYVVVNSDSAPDARVARCIAVGPHRDLNIVDWCCR